MAVVDEMVCYGVWCWEEKEEWGIMRVCEGEDCEECSGEEEDGAEG